MQKLTLSFYQRVMIWNMVGTHQVANLKEASVYLRLIEKIRLTDTEEIESELKTNGLGGFSWKLPEPDYGTKDVQLENEEGKALVKCFEGPQALKVNDAAWILGIVGSLEEKEETASA